MEIDNKTLKAVYENLSDVPQSRFTLAAKLGISERTFRESVRQLRNKGVPVIADSQNFGYKIGTGQEIRQTVSELRSKAFSMLHTASALERNLDGQVELDV